MTPIVLRIARPRMRTNLRCCRASAHLSVGYIRRPKAGLPSRAYLVDIFSVLFSRLHLMSVASDRVISLLRITRNIFSKGMVSIPAVAMIQGDPF